VHERARIYRDADVRGARIRRIKEDEVARSNFVRVDAPALVELPGDRTGQLDTGLAEHIANEPAAVESRPRFLAAEPIRGAEKGQGIVKHLVHASVVP
jgi:hypothetical protein